MSRRFVIGDIHGAHKALLECFEKSSFNRDEDMLICLGDICDGWPEVNKVFDELLDLKNLVYILGNHDKWALDWFLYHNAPSIWTKQGGLATIESYKEKIPETHVQLLIQAHLYYQLEDKVFVHGGFNPDLPIQQQNAQIFLWDRDLVYRAINENNEDDTNTHITAFNEIYIGHTPTINLGTTKPVRACEVIMMDTGAGWPGGVLTMMDIDSKEIAQSICVDELYPYYAGRGS